MTGDDDKTAQAGREKAAASQSGSASGAGEKKTREDRLAEALRANLRRRKAAAKERKSDC
jgi:hypothetical protein